jgi:hypothetical protein
MSVREFLVKSARRLHRDFGELRLFFQAMNWLPEATPSAHPGAENLSATLHSGS